MSRSVMFAIFFSLAFWTIFPKLSTACECVSIWTVQEDLKHSDLVFAGKAVQISDDYPYGLNEVTFQVSRVWKGDVHETTTFNMVAGDSCMSHFSIGSEYLVYAVWDPQGVRDPSMKDLRDKIWPRHRLNTTACGRTSILKGNPDLRVLGQGYAPSSEKPLIYTCALCIGILALFKIGVAIFKRRRHIAIE